MAVNERNGGGGQGNAEHDPRLDRLYGETAREAPPARLDQAILAAAHREVGSGPRSLSARVRRWRVPVSLAAVIVLSVSLVTLLREEGGEPLAPQPPSRAPAPPAASAPAEAEAGARPAQPPATAPAASMRAAPGDDARSGPSAERARKADSTRRDEVTLLAQGAQTAPAPETGAQAVPRPFQATPGAARETTAQPKAPAAAEERAGAPAVSVGRVAPPVAAAPTPDAARAKAPARSPQAAAAPALVRLPPWHSLEKEPPGKWLERVAELRQLGRTAEADELLAEFKRRFPDHRVPPGLE